MMSDMVLLVVPSDPYWQPTKDGAERAIALLSRLYPNADNISAANLGEVGFHHPYECWEGVFCPACKDDVEAWFFPELNRLYEFNRFCDLRTTTPCCNFKTSLDQLDYPGPAAFGKFILEVLNPGRGGLPTEIELGDLTSCLGSQVRMLWRRI